MFISQSPKTSLLLLSRQQQQQPARCATNPADDGCGCSKCSCGSKGNCHCNKNSNSKLPLREVYSRFAAEALINTTASGAVALLTALLTLRRTGLRVFTVGMGIGAPLGWSLKDADLYLKDPITYYRLLPETSDPLVLAKHLQNRLFSNLNTPYLLALRQRFFPTTE